MKLREVELNSETINKAIQQDKEEDEEQVKQAELKKIKRDLLQQFKEIYMYSEERDLVSNPDTRRDKKDERDPFFRIHKDQVNQLMIDDKAKAIMTYHNWERPQNTGKSTKKEFNKNAFYVSEQAKNLKLAKKERRDAKGKQIFT